MYSLTETDQRFIIFIWIIPRNFRKKIICSLYITYINATALEKIQRNTELKFEKEKLTASLCEKPPSKSKSSWSYRSMLFLLLTGPPLTIPLWTHYTNLLWIYNYILKQLQFTYWHSNGGTRKISRSPSYLKNS